MTFYNEHDPFAAAWLERLVGGGHIAPGHVDVRSIEAVQPGDIGNGQAHFFAGIGGWSHTLRLAGVPDDAPVWTGSCPCQPFSIARKRKAKDDHGLTDKRHLWPEFRRLIAARLPPVVLGEQVASPDGRSWLAVVRNDLEKLGYAFGAADLCAASVGAPQIRQRLFWGAVRVADAGRLCLRGAGSGAPGSTPESLQDSAPGSRQRVRPDLGAVGGAAPVGLGSTGRSESEQPPWSGAGSDSAHGAGPPSQPDGSGQHRSGGPRTHTSDGYWSTADWLFCRDVKWRPVEPGTFPLAHGLPARVGRLRGYGNAIVPQVAAVFVRAFLDSVADL